MNLSYSEKDPDIAVVVGGDGTFGYYGRILRIPMLFVGVNDPDILGSKAKLAGVSFDDLSKALMCIKLGRYFVDKRRMFSLTCGTKKLVDILTDVYLERGTSSHGIRYALSVFSTNKFKQSSRQTFTEYAIGNGVIISTSFGSGGYYSYPQRIKLDRYNDNDTSIQKRFSDNKIGICHIIPTFLLRLGNETEGKKYNNNNNEGLVTRFNILSRLSQLLKSISYGMQMYVCMVYLTIQKELQLESKPKYLLIDRIVLQKSFNCIGRISVNNEYFCIYN